MSRFDSKTSKNTAANTAEKSEEITLEGVEMTEEIVDDFPADVVVDTDSDTPEDAAEVSEEVVEVEAEPDISEFVALVESLIVVGADGDVENITPEVMTQIQTAYKDLSRKEKNLAKISLAESMEKAITEKEDLSLAKFYLEISTTGTVAPKVKKEAKAPKVANPIDALAKHIAKLDLARAIVNFGDLNEDDVRAKAAEIYALGVEDYGKDEPELVWVKQAINLATPKKAVAKTDSGETRTRHSVANHIAEAFANANSGESLTLEDLLKFKSEEYGDESPSKQAVQAHLVSKKFQQAAALSVGTDDKGMPVLTKK